ncbi:unnamed protein product [Ostreobium quekettii]|uniref:Uncharacterized protein n=1 Tax=Ostreobium quekettii TaxID=121088 RepID=A0A8S1IRC8_9CHLO|nr:unnamed protein product [Ostreobium quekettii]
MVSLTDLVQALPSYSLQISIHEAAQVICRVLIPLLTFVCVCVCEMLSCLCLLLPALQPQPALHWCLLWSHSSSSHQFGELSRGRCDSAVAIPHMMHPWCLYGLFNETMQ